MTTTLAVKDQAHRLPGPERATVLKAFLALLAITFLLRIFYSGHLYQDDGLWFTAAEQVLGGKALYREVYFDKPPGLPLLYALLFKLFGAHILTIRLFTIFYAVAISGALYLFGARFYGKRTGLVAAAMFAVFSTTYTAGHVQGLNTDFLMALPYTAGAYFLARSCAENSRARLLALAGGALTGVASQINPKAVFNLVFFAALLLISYRKQKAAHDQSAAYCLLPTAFYILGGFIAGSLLLLGHVAATKSLTAYWLYVWDWGARYASYYPASKVFLSALQQSAGYFALNPVLLIALVYFVVSMARRARAGERSSDATFNSDVTLLLWLAASYAGLAVGGRFFGHYFLQIIPALCLIGARGVTGIIRNTEALGLRTRRLLIAGLVIGFAFTLVRFHGRTALLAVDWMSGTKSEATAGWFHERLNREEKMAAAAVRELTAGAEDVEKLDFEAVRNDGPRARGARGPEDYLFVWGYRPEIYYWSGLLPASRYLSTQPLTGVPADVHYFGRDYGYLLDEATTARARSELLGELEQVRPKHIVEELGFFNASLGIQKYHEFEEFMRGYKFVGATGRFLIYQRRRDK